MHETDPRPLLCERTREWVALRLDAELSEFETALMDAHLERCGACRAFGAEIAAITEALRAEPLEVPELPVRLPARQRLVHHRFQVVAAAAVIGIAAGLGGLLGSVRSAAPDVAASAQQHTPMLASAVGDPLLRDLRLATLVVRTAPSIGDVKPALNASA